MDQLAFSQRAYALFDTSRVSTFFVAIMLIVYGSFRSLNIENNKKEKNGGVASADAVGGWFAVQTIDSTLAVLLPIGASISLICMFLMFDSLQTMFAICTAVIATVALAFLLLPLCQYVLRTCGTSDGQWISFACFGRYSPAELLSFGLSFTLVCLWLLTGHWILMDALGMAMCVAFIALVRLPSLKVSTVLLSGLLLYDVFWVFFSSYIFNANVMVRVATRPADNPIGAFAKRLQTMGVLNVEPPKLSLPAKLVFPSTTGHLTMLGLGDVVMPGLLLCFVLRYDRHKRKNQITPHRVTYFQCSLVGYSVGLLTATLSAEVFKAAQPALLYLVPFTLLPLIIMAYVKGDLRRMWLEPFTSNSASKCQII